MEFQINKKYDPTKGRFVRAIKSNDTFHLSTAGAVTGGAGTIVATTTSSTNKDLYITHFSVGASANSTQHVLAGGSTILPINTAASNTTSIIGDVNSPLYKLDCTTAQTISIISDTAGTFTAFLSGFYHPIFSKVETA